MPKKKKEAPEVKNEVQPEVQPEVNETEALQAEVRGLIDLVAKLEAELEAKAKAESKEARTLLVPVPGKGIIFGVEGMGVTYVPGGKMINGKIQ